MVLVLGLGASGLAAVAAAPPAAAATSFTCLTPTDFLVIDTTLYSATEPSTGLPTAADWTKLASGLPADINALGFDPSDGLLYAIAPNQSTGDQDLIQIDSTGAEDNLGAISGLPSGASFATGGFDPDGNYWVSTNDDSSSQAWSIDVTASPPTATAHGLSGGHFDATDWTYADGYFWGNDDAIWRLDPSTDVVQSYSTGFGLGANAAWTFANGDLGFYDSSSNVDLRLALTDPSGSPPSYSEAAPSSTGPESGAADADGTSCALVAVTGAAPADGAVGQAYSATLGATGGPTPADYAWAITSGSLPPGLSLDSSSGTISGTPTTEGSYSFTVQVTANGAFPVTATQSYSMSVAASPLSTSSTLSDGTYGSAYSATLSASGGTTPYTWSLASGSSLPPGLQLDPNLGTISGTPTEAGSFTFTVQVADSSDPQQTATQQLTLTVDPVPLTITASSPSMTYGATPPAITATYSGFVNGDGPSSLSTPPTCSTTATSSSSVGTYPTSCSGAVDSNYTISYVGGSVSVGQAVLTITASSPSVTYGSATPAITPSYNGFLNGDSASSLSSQPTCSTTETSSSPVGSYPSSCSGASDPNYSISYDPGSVTVGPAVLMITASSGSSTYGSAPPTITPTYTGFVGSDGPSSLTTPATCSTAATASSAAGSYSSSCSGASDPNYTITYIAGTVTVNPAALTITASSGSSTYGGSPPAITASYSGFENGDTASSLSTQPTCSTAATASSAAGTYTSSCTGAADPNYTFTYVNGSVTVKPAPLTITASSPSMTYGATPPTINASYNGFVNGDTALNLTNPPTCSTTATASSPVGTYPSSCSGATDPNYTISYVAGTVTVGQAGTTLAYTGPATISAGTALVPSASLTSSASACQSGQPVSFSLSANPKTGVAGSYSLGSATTTSSGTATAPSVSTTGWEAGAYTVTATYAGTTNCDAASVTAALAVTQAGDVAAGAGTYSVSGVGPVTFGFVVWKIPLTSLYFGGISVVGGGWSLTGPVTGYSLTSSTQGVLTGSGTLSWWNTALNHGHGGWQVASSSVPFTATFTVTSKTSPGSFGIKIAYTPVSPQPATLPNSAPIALKSGLIVN